ncbi:MAG: hypothetical protein ACI8UO_005830 [Verrucomicrobiales bacterium]|jgi:hypothetical protein
MKTSTFAPLPFELSETPIMPERSQLYSLQPLGSTTGLLESVTSYIMRLADAHCVSVSALVREIIGPLIPYSSVRSRGRNPDLFRKMGASFNGHGQVGKHCLEVLIMLTHRPEIRELNTQFLEPYVSGRGILRNQQAWCPECLHDWMSHEHTLYLPLAWNLSTFKVCPIHNANLVQCCPICEEEHTALNRDQRPGFCPTCKTFLGSKSSSPKNSPTLNWDLQASRMTLAFLKAGRGRLRSLPRNRFGENMEFILKQSFSGNLTPMAKLLHITRSSLKQWILGKQVPTMNYLLWVSYRSGQNPLDLLTLSNASMPPFCVHTFGNNGDLDFVRHQCRPSQRSKVESALKELIESPESPPPSLKQLAKRLGTHISSISRQHPQAAQIIKERYQAHQEESRLRRERQEREAVESAVRKLHADGAYPSIRKVRDLLPNWRMLRNPTLADHRRQLIHKLGYPDPSARAF